MPYSVSNFQANRTVHYRAQVRTAEIERQTDHGTLEKVQYIDLNGDGEFNYTREILGKRTSEPVLMSSLEELRRYKGQKENPILTDTELWGDNLGSIDQMEDKVITVKEGPSYQDLAYSEIPRLDGRAAGLNTETGEFFIHTPKRS